MTEQDPFDEFLEWWDSLTPSEQQREEAQMLLEDRRAEELEKMIKAHREDEYQHNRAIGEHDYGVNYHD